MIEDFIDIDGDCEEPSFYKGSSLAQEAMAEYLRDHPNGVGEILKWLGEVEAERKEWKRRSELSPGEPKPGVKGL